MEGVGVEDDRRVVPCFGAPLGNPDPSSIEVVSWVVAEDAGREVLTCVHPTLDSAEERKDVIDHVQELIIQRLGLQVFPYGSVPLKTYLPDGDIDLTVVSTPNFDELLPYEVLRILQDQEKKEDAKFDIRDAQLIHAEVKLVKCFIQDIVVDISFNQLGGLCTLCFLEQVDRLAGKNHLFKRSLLLIKAWCYYESRILGAHHGLLSTYALEILVLYIFHIFHASLNGPLEVFYRFLDYYGKFDWDNYCISIDGPVSKSSLAGSAVEIPDNQGTDVLLNAEFRKNCLDTFIVPSKGSEADLQTFKIKSLNIIDPLKETNNLGRSVRKGNYFRIRSAFRYGARRLGRILQQPNINIDYEIKGFFRNTLQRHTPRPSSPLIASAMRFGTLSISPRSESSHEGDMFSRFVDGDHIEFVNYQNAPPLTESNLEEEHESVDENIDLWMERRGSALTDGDMVSLHVHEDNNGGSSDNVSLDGEEEESDDSIGDIELLNLFPDLTGDYNAHIRNLLYAQGCHGYALSKTMVWTSLSPPISPYGDENQCDQAAAAHLSPNHINRSNGGVGHDTRRGTGTFIPVMVTSTASSFATRRRKLEFGSFRSMSENPSNEQSLEVDAHGREEERMIESSLHLDDDDEFPPLPA